MKKILILIMLALGLHCMPAQAFSFERDKQPINMQKNENSITHKHFIIAAAVVVVLIGTFIVAAQKGHFKNGTYGEKETHPDKQESLACHVAEVSRDGYDSESDDRP